RGAAATLARRGCTGETARPAERGTRAARLQFLHRRRACAYRPAQARGTARQARRRAHDPRELELGRAPRRARHRGDLPRAVDRQGTTIGPRRAARGPGRALLRLDELAAASLCRSRESVAADGRAARAPAAVHAKLASAALGNALLPAHLGA